jgi:hypothetical protein
VSVKKRLAFSYHDSRYPFVFDEHFDASGRSCGVTMGSKRYPDLRAAMTERTPELLAELDRKQAEEAE